MHRVYGSRISYYTGKLETYLRYRGMAYERANPHADEHEVIEGAGVVQHPVLRLDDGRWLSDTTPMLAWFDAQDDEPSIYPDDPALRFAALLLEDHADEWLWRPAMYFRWSFLQDRQYASEVLADELLPHVPLPRAEKRALLVRRQRGGFVLGDGVTAATCRHVERTAMAAFDLLEATLAERPFLLGDRPSIADFGFAGPMLRHFGQDPTPAERMRERAPRLYSWVARMWEARPAAASAAFVPALDAPLAALLREAGETHLVQLRENARAYDRGESHFAQEVQGCRYEELPVSRYRVWCLEELRRHWQALGTRAQAALREHLPEPEAAVLWDAEPYANSGYDPERRAPFNRAINVFDGGVPS